MRCCRSEPRCRACPLMLHKELRDVRALGSPSLPAELSPHLADLPQCLHKYGPLFADSPDVADFVRDETAA
jgi:hypothetical protein